MDCSAVVIPVTEAVYKFDPDYKQLNNVDGKNCEACK
jgi:hypothetical protein